MQLNSFLRCYIVEIKTDDDLTCKRFKKLFYRKANRWSVESCFKSLSCLMGCQFSKQRLSLRNNDCYLGSCDFCCFKVQEKTRNTARWNADFPWSSLHQLVPFSVYIFSLILGSIKKRFVQHEWPISGARVLFCLVIYFLWLLKWHFLQATQVSSK